MIYCVDVSWCGLVQTPLLLHGDGLACVGNI